MIKFIFYTLWVSYISISWWFFTGVWVTNSPQVSSKLFNILADFTNAVVWTVSSLPVISKLSSPCTNLLVTFLRIPITNGITVTFMFHIFFNSLASSWYLSFFSLSFNFTLGSAGTASSQFCKFSFFGWLLYGLVVWPKLGDLFVSQNPRGICF